MYESKYFKPSEFRCKCPRCKGNPDPEVDETQLKRLDMLREKAGIPLTVNCGQRCKEHNTEVGGAEKSFHMKKKVVATDIDASKTGVEKLAKMAEECGFDGIGKYPKSNFVHVDSRGYKACWVG